MNIRFISVPIMMFSLLLSPLSLQPAVSQELSPTSFTGDYSDNVVKAYASPVTELSKLAEKEDQKTEALTDNVRSLGVSEPLVLEGEASYYSRAGCLGCDPMMIMANGQPLDDSALTMAIGANLKHLVGYHATVTSLVTGQSVKVLITDTGGFYQEKYGHRVADLTIATKQAIGMKGGVGQVRVEVR